MELAFNSGGVSNLNIPAAALPVVPTGPPVVGQYYMYECGDFNKTRIRVKVVKLDPPDGESVVVRLPNGQERITVYNRLLGTGMLSRQISTQNVT